MQDVFFRLGSAPPKKSAYKMRAYKYVNSGKELHVIDESDTSRMSHACQRKQETPPWKRKRRATFMAETVTVFGVFEDHKKAEQALLELKRAGFRDEQLGFAVRQRRSSQTETRERLAVAAGGVIAGLLAAAETLFLPLIGPLDLTSVLQSTLPVEERVERAIEGRLGEEEASRTEQPTSQQPAAGEAESEQERRAIVVEADAAAGSLVGGFLGAVAALLIPGIGPVAAGGILLTPLVSAAVGALAGDVIGGLVGMGLSEEAAQLYAHEFEAGRTLVSVKADDPQQAREAQDILLRLGARDVQAH
jgi:hypothetical protein